MSGKQGFLFTPGDGRGWCMTAVEHSVESLCENVVNRHAYAVGARHVGT